MKSKCTEECIGFDEENCECNVTDYRVPVNYGDDCFLEEDPCPLREYVIVCNRNRKNGEDLLFWGSLTRYDEKRSFGGYTSEVDKCEKYTLEDIKSWKGYSPEYYVMFDDVDPAKFNEYPDVICTIQQLESIGFHRVTAMRM